MEFGEGAIYYQSPTYQAHYVSSASARDELPYSEAGHPAGVAGAAAGAATVARAQHVHAYSPVPAPTRWLAS